jgi:hypothetical protein
MAYEQQQFEKTHLLETTAKVKQVREEVTKKVSEPKCIWCWSVYYVYS